MALLTACLCLPFTARVCGFFGLRKNILRDMTFSRAFYDRNGRLLRIVISPDEKYRLFVPLEQIPQTLRQSVLLYEDRHFYRHFGVNPFALMRAAKSTFSGGKRMGASTITMQTARKIYNIDSRTTAGKITQILAAFWLEIRCTKDQIFEAYLNIAPYGYNIEGVGAASLIYFGGRTQDINLLEAMTLAVIPQNPKDRVPSRAKGFANMQTARAELYRQWVKTRPQDKKFASFFTMSMNIKDPSRLPFETPHIVNYLSERESAPEVFTSADLEMQKSFEERVRLYIARNKSKGILNASVLLLNYKTMEVEAALGSADFWDDGIYGQVNGFAAKRLIASAFKPFIYAMALDKGLIHPATLLKDTPRRFGVYSPENADRSFAGPVLAGYALNSSRNIPAIELMMNVGQEEYAGFLKAAGVGGLKDAGYYGISLAIGTFEVTPVEAARLYAVLANGGEYKDLTFIKGGAPAQNAPRLLSPEAAFITLDMIKNTSGLRRKIRGSVSRSVPVYAKTGTSSSFKDAWTAGVFGDYVMVVWVGNFNGEGNNSFWGRTAAQPLFFELVEQVVKNRPQNYFGPRSREGLNIIETEVCKGTGDLPGRYCPQTEKTLFIPGVSPIKVSDIHRLVYIDNATGLRACRYNSATVKAEVFEFWPSEIEALFKAAGITHRPVPRYVEGCVIEEASAKGAPPVIILPAQGVKYPFRERDARREIIPLRADTDKDARAVYWFMDNKFMGSAPAGETLFVRPAPGRFNIRAVDDLGRAASCPIEMTLEAD